MSFLKNKNLYFILIFLTALFWGLSKQVPYLQQNTQTMENPSVIRGYTMGTYYVVSYFPNENNRINRKKVEKAISSDLEEVNRQMSTYIEDSEISLLNKQTKDHPFAISPWFNQVLSYSLELSKKTSGYFDPTVGPLVNLFGFGPQKIEKYPSPSEIKKVLNYVGYKKIVLEKGAIRKKHPKTYLDLSSVAKGFAVDEISRHLNALGFKNHLVEIGGEIKAQGHKANNQNWLIGIEKPQSKRTIHHLITLKDQAIATSGDYRNYSQTAQGTFTHTINPKTGDALISRLLSVSVLAKECMEADATATALMVMGENKAKEFVKVHKVPAMFIIQEGKGLKTVMTERFKKSLLRKA